MSILNSKDKTINWLSGQIGMTRSGLKLALEGETIGWRKIKEISIVLSVPISEILSVKIENEGSEPIKVILEMQKALLNERERTIKDKEEIIEMLKERQYPR